jgi:tRNA (pseudouridine54-N1)-methyltransferase
MNPLDERTSGQGPREEAPALLRRFVVLGRRARPSPDFSLSDLPSTSGRLDVLLRCLRAALLVSHGLRRDTVVYLALLGDPAAPRTLRFDGESARYIRPDERALALLVQKSLSALVPAPCPGFVTVRPGIAVADGGLDLVLADLGPSAFYVLEEGAADLRACPRPRVSPVFFIGDDRGFDASARAVFAEHGARAASVGPVSLHADDAVVLVQNELDRWAVTG